MQSLEAVAKIQVNAVFGIVLKSLGALVGVLVAMPWCCYRACEAPAAGVQGLDFLAEQADAVVIALVVRQPTRRSVDRGPSWRLRVRLAKGGAGAAKPSARLAGEAAGRRAWPQFRVSDFDLYRPLADKGRGRAVDGLADPRYPAGDRRDWQTAAQVPRQLTAALVAGAELLRLCR